MSKNLNDNLIKTPGLVLVSEKGAEGAGFDFNYKHEHFDGCRMGALSPVMWAQDKITQAIQAQIIHSENRITVATEGQLSPYELAEDFAPTLLRLLPFECGSDDMNVFLHTFEHRLYELNTAWAKTENA